MVFRAAVQRICLLAFAFLFFTFNAIHAQAQSSASMPLNGGTLSWTVSSRSGYCGPMSGAGYFTLVTDSNFQYSYGGTVYTLTGNAAVLETSGNCGIGVNPTTLTFSTSNFGSSCSIVFTPTTAAGQHGSVHEYKLRRQHNYNQQFIYERCGL